MLNWLLRYQPAIEILDEFGADGVIDVGAGWHGITRWWPHPAVQTDLQFTRPPLDESRVGAAGLVRSSAQALPFADGAFDFALSLDMIEHLPVDIRAESIRELARVARRGFIIGFPVGDRARALDQSLARLVRWTRRPLPDWLDEHLSQVKYPDRSTVLEALPDGWLITREIPVGNLISQRLVVLMDMTPGLGRAAASFERSLSRRGRVLNVLNRGKTYRTIWLVCPSTTPSRP